MGSVDILVNNAGITRDQIFMRMSDEEWQSVLDVNLTSTMRLCRGVMRPMMKARLGPDREYLFGGRGYGQSWAGQLCRFEGGDGGSDQIHRL